MISRELLRLAELLDELEDVLLALLRLFLVELRSLLVDFFSFFGDISSGLILGDFTSFLDLMLGDFSSFLKSIDFFFLSVLGELDEFRSALTRDFIAELTLVLSSSSLIF